MIWRLMFEAGVVVFDPAQRLFGIIDLRHGGCDCRCNAELLAHTQDLFENGGIFDQSPGLDFEILHLHAAQNRAERRGIRVDGHIVRIEDAGLKDIVEVGRFQPRQKQLDARQRRKAGAEFFIEIALILPKRIGAVGAVFVKSDEMLK